MLPAEWSDMGEQIVTDPFAIGAQFGNGMAEVDSVPKDDRGYDEIEARSPVALIFELLVAGFSSGTNMISRVCN
jgi:hypothetical protein